MSSAKLRPVSINLTLALFLSLAVPLLADDFDDAANGNWSSSATWGGGPPSAGDTALIDSHNVTNDTPDPITVGSVTVGKSKGTTGTLTVNQNMVITNQLRILGRDYYAIAGGDGVHKITTVDLLWDGLTGASGYGVSIAAGAIIEASGVNSRLSSAMDRNPNLNGTVRILSGGVFDYQLYRQMNGSGQFIVDSGATFKKSGVSATTYMGPAFTNNGTVQILSSALGLVLSNDRDDAGDWQIEEGATLSFNYAGTNVTHNGAFSGDGNVTLISGSAYVKTIEGSYTLGGTTTIGNSSGGTVRFNHPATFGSLATYYNGDLELQLGAETYAVTNEFRLGFSPVSGAGIGATTLNVNDFVIDATMNVGRTLLSGLTLNVSGANSAYYYNDRTPTSIDANVNLLDGAVFNLQQESTRYLAGTGTWTNWPGATFKKAAGTESKFQIRFVNAGGTVSAEGGKIYFSLANGFSQTAGRTVLDGQPIQVVGTTDIDGGSLAFTVTTNNAGVLTAATLNLNSCALELALADGFEPTPVESFTIVTATTLSGGFTNVVSGERLTMVDSDSFRVVVTTGSSGTVVLDDYKGPPAGTVITIR